MLQHYLILSVHTGYIIIPLSIIVTIALVGGGVGASGASPTKVNESENGSLGSGLLSSVIGTVVHPSVSPGCIVIVPVVPL